MNAKIGKAIAFVRNKGKPFDILLLDHLLDGDEQKLASIEQAMADMQNEDGGWGERPYGVPLGQASNLTNTYMARLLIEDLELVHSPLISNATRYIMQHQAEDGRFDDHSSIMDFNPPRWMQPGRESVIVWKTAAVINTLVQLPENLRPQLDEPVQLLLDLWRSGELFSGYYHASWWVMSIAARLYGPEHEAVPSCAEYLQRVLPTLPIHEDYMHALEACRTAGFPADHPLVTTCLRLLDESQNADGSWTNEFGEAWSVDVTIRVLRLYDLYREKVRAHTG